jgi:hypothetical protein
VHTEVLRHGAPGGSSVIAVGAPKALLPSVYQQVRRQIALVPGTIVAVSTRKRLLSSVHQQVCRQVALATRTIVAVSALIGFLPSVCPQVTCDGALMAGTIVAVGALVGLLSTVYPQVRRQVALVAGAKVAVGARVNHHPRQALWHEAATCPEPRDTTPAQVPYWGSRRRGTRRSAHERVVCMSSHGLLRVLRPAPRDDEKCTDAASTRRWKRTTLCDKTHC